MQNAKYLFLLTCWLGASTLGAQTFNAFLKAGDEEFAIGNYYAALQRYQEAIDIEEDRADVRYKAAEAARQFQAYQQASRLYQGVRADSLQRAAYPLATYWQGRMQHRLGNYDQARMLYDQFLAEQPARQDEFAQKARRLLEELDWVEDQLNRADEAAPRLALARMTDDYNSPYTDFDATFVGDTLFYSSFAYAPPVDDDYTPSRIYGRVLYSVDGGAPELWAALNDSTGHTGHTAFNRDHTRLYYTLCAYVGQTTDLHCSLYTRTYDAGHLGPKTRLSDAVNLTGYTHTEPAVGYDPASGEERLYYVSDRPLGKGGLDLWYAPLRPDGTAGTPVNLAVLNTDEDDITPSYHQASRTLYFSSERSPGFGGFDVYQSRLGETGDWGAPRNLGAAVNTSYHDIYYHLNEGETLATLASNRPGSQLLDPDEGACCYDLYQFESLVFDLLARSFDARNRLPLEGVTFTLSELRPDGTLVPLEERLGVGNEFTAELEKGKVYVISGAHPDYLVVSDTLYLDGNRPPSSYLIETDLYLLPKILDLHVETFVQNSGEPLNGAVVQLFEYDDEIDLQSHPNDNQYRYKLDRDNLYKVIASKPGYFSDTLVLDLSQLGNPLTMNEKLYLQEKEVEDFPPLTLYFDNDRPNPRSRATTTNVSYEQAYRDYYRRKGEFINEYTKVLEGRDSFLAERRMEAFFEREVKDSYESIDVFSSKVLERLENGERIKLFIKGYTSPRAGADYNYLLGQRRVATLRNHFDRYAGGILRGYMNSGQLLIEEISFGETTAPQIISDKLKDERNSIYGIRASMERRVEIVGLQVNNNAAVGRTQ